MKRVLIFIGLKIAELVGASVGLYLLWVWAEWMNESPRAQLFLIIPLGLFCIGITVFGLWRAVQANWKWSGKITGKLVFVFLLLCAGAAWAGGPASPTDPRPFPSTAVTRTWTAPKTEDIAEIKIEQLLNGYEITVYTKKVTDTGRIVAKSSEEAATIVNSLLNQGGK